MCPGRSRLPARGSLLAAPPLAQSETFLRSVSRPSPFASRGLRPRTTRHRTGVRFLVALCPGFLSGLLVAYICSGRVHLFRSRTAHRTGTGEAPDPTNGCHGPGRNVARAGERGSSRTASVASRERSPRASSVRGMSTAAVWGDHREPLTRGAQSVGVVSGPLCGRDVRVRYRGGVVQLCYPRHSLSRVGTTTPTLTRATNWSN